MSFKVDPAGDSYYLLCYFRSYILSFIQVSRIVLLVMSFDIKFEAIMLESSGWVAGYPKVLELGEQISHQDPMNN